MRELTRQRGERAIRSLSLTGPRASPAKRAAWGKEAQRSERAHPPAGKRAIRSLRRRGWDGWTRTSECGSQSPVPYHLATPQY